MRVALCLIALGAAAPAAAQSGYNLAQLLGYGFTLHAAVPAPPGGKPAADALYLQGRLPGSAQDIVARCIVRPDDRDGKNNCQRVY